MSDPAPVRNGGLARLKLWLRTALALCFIGAFAIVALAALGYPQLAEMLINLPLKLAPAVTGP